MGKRVNPVPMQDRARPTGLDPDDGEPGDTLKAWCRIKKNRGMSVWLKRCCALILSPLAAVLLVVHERATASEPVAPDATVATVNGEPVTSREFRRAMLRFRTRVRRSFPDEQSIYTGLGLQNTGYEDEVSIQRLRQLALEACVRRKVEWLLARDLGLAEKDISDGRFLERLAEENTRRKEALRRGEVIYGPTQYREDVYWGYVHDELVRKLKERLAQSKCVVGDEALRDFYHSRAERYHRPVRVKVKRMVVPFEAGGNSYPTRAAARRLMEAAQKRVTNGEPFETVSKEFASYADFDAPWREESQCNDLAWMSERVREAALQLSPGEVSSVVEDGKAFYLLLCEEREAAVVYAYEEVRDDVIEEYVDERYESHMDTLVEQAEIVVNQDIYLRMGLTR